MATLGFANIQDLAVSPDGTRLALVSTTSPYLKVINISDKSVDSGWPTPAVGGVGGVAWAPNGNRLALFGFSSPYLAVVDVATKSVESGWQAGLAGAYNGKQNSVGWSPSSDRIVTFTGQYDVWLTSTKLREAGWPAMASATAQSGQFSPDGTMLAIITGSTSAARRLNVVTVSTKTLDTAWPTMAESATASQQGVAWSPSGDRLVVTNYRSGEWVGVIDVATKTRETGWPVYASSMAQGVKFEPDGTVFGVGGSSPTTVYRTTVATKTNVATYTLGTAVSTIDFGWSLVTSRGLVVGSMTLS